MTRTLSVVLGLAACGQPPAESNRRANQPDKSALYADPGLVPTREGERARRELALAGEIAAALRELPEVKQVFVTVAETTDEDSTARVLVTGSISAEARVERLSADAARIATTVIGEGASVECRWSAGTPEDDPSPVRPALWLALLALGASAGITLDRARRRR